MRLNQFEIIAALENCNSLSEVAEKLFLTQPSVSKAIRELEEEIGYKVLRRTKTGVEFTEMGEEVLRNAKQIMTCIKAIKNQQVVINEEISGKISLGVTRYWGSDIFTQVLWNFNEQYPNVSIWFCEGFSSDIIAAIEQRQLNLGIIMTYSTDKETTQQRILESSLEYKTLFVDKVKLYVSLNHELHEKNTIYMKDVVPYSYVTGGNVVVAKHSQQLLQSYGYQKDVEIINNQQLRLRYLVRQNAFTSLPDRLFQSSVEYQKFLKPIHVQDLQWECELGVVYHADEIRPLEEILLQRMQEKIK